MLKIVLNIFVNRDTFVTNFYKSSLKKFAKSKNPKFWDGSVEITRGNYLHETSTTYNHSFQFFTVTYLY